MRFVSEKGHLEVVSALIGAGACLNLRDEHGKTALMLALDEGHEEVIRMLTEAGAELNA